MGDADPARARSLIQEVGLEKLSLEAIGWLLPVLSDDPASTAEVAAIRRHLLNRVTETAGAAHFVTSYGDKGYVLLHSDRRADGILLDALIGDQPESDLIPKLVRGLLAQRKAGRWTNTQENSFILLALDRYFNTYEAQTPDFVARIWLGEQYAGEAAFRGRTTDYQQIDVPMSVVAAQPGTQDLILSKDGPGRLYYRLGLRYAPTDLSLPPYDAGFTVERTYEAVDDPADVRRDADGAWRIKAGARVRVQAHHGRACAALPRGAGRPAAGRAGAAEPGAGDHRQPAGPIAERDSNPRLLVVGPLVRAPEPARSAARGVRIAAVGRRALTATSPVRPRPASSSSRRPRPRRCTRRRRSAGAVWIG